MFLVTVIPIIFFPSLPHPFPFMTSLPSTSIKRIAKEIKSLQLNPPEDIQLINNDGDLTEIQAWIRGPDGTPYEEGYFRIRLALEKDFPDTPPKGYFQTKIFHPNVSPTGEICVNTLKKDWKPELGIEQVLLTIKCLLIVPNAESALNEEAGKLLLEQYDVYAKRASLYTSIHAKAGKQAFASLHKERLHNEENKNIGNIPLTPDKCDTNENQPILKPLLNSASHFIDDHRKRKVDDLEADNQIKSNKSNNMKKNDKKRSLRRL